MKVDLARAFDMTGIEVAKGQLCSYIADQIFIGIVKEVHANLRHTFRNWT
jgi:hypothetical protein